MSLQTIDESSSEKALRNSRSLSGGKNVKLFSKIASSVKFVMRASNNDTETASDPKNRKTLFRKDSRCKRIIEYFI